MAKIQQNRLTVVTFVLGVLLVCSVGYIGIDKYNAVQSEKINTITTNAINSGVQYASYQLYIGSNNCQPVVVSITDAEGNEIQRQLIDQNCCVQG